MKLRQSKRRDFVLPALQFHLPAGNCFAFFAVMHLVEIVSIYNIK